MDKLKLSLLGAAALVAMNGQAALAADLLPEPPVIEVPEIVQKKVGGWYIRGDIGYNWKNDRGYERITLGFEDFDESETDDTFGLRGGIGYQINQNFRVDATVDYKFASAMNGLTTGAGHCDTTFVPAAGETWNCSSADSSEHTQLGLMANAYADLGTFGGLTPYIGAGIGGTYVSYDQLNQEQTSTCTGTCAAPTSLGSGTHDGIDSWRFSYALHAGASYDISHALKLDVGYSYTRVEGGPSHGWVNSAVPPINGAQIFDKGFDEHAIRAGLRYHIW